MSIFQDWLNSKKIRRLVPFEESHSIGRDLERHTVSLKASGIFPVTYSLVINAIVMSLIEEE